MSEPLLSPFAKRRIADLANGLLRSADALGTLPTPIEAVQRAAGIKERIDIANLPPELAAMKPAGMDRILGAALLAERTVFIDTSQPAPRRLFTDAHETVHLMCGWHQEALMLDTEATLFRDTQQRIEAEANYGASCLIFQGDDFARRAWSDPPSISIPLALADVYGASRHSALHFYVEEHPGALALLVAGRYPHSGGNLPIWRTVESASFLRRFGGLLGHLPGGRLLAQPREGDPLAGLLSQSSRANKPARVGVALREPAADRRVRFYAEAFYNGRCHFVLLSERPPVRTRSRATARRAVRDGAAA